MGIALSIRLRPVESDGFPHAELGAAGSLKACTSSLEVNALDVEHSALLSMHKYLVLESLVLGCGHRFHKLAAMFTCRGC